MKTKLQLLSLSAAMFACGLGMSTSAQANAYAFSFNHIKDGLVTVTNGLATPGVSQSSTSTSGTPLPVTRAGDSQYGPSVPPPDALPATQGSLVRLNETLGVAGPTGTSYTQFGQTVTSYSWSDAKIISEQSNTGSAIEAWGAAEGNINPTGNATAQATNGSTNTLFYTIELDGTGTIKFSFLANPFMQYALDAAAIFPSRASANLDFNITITGVTGDNAGLEVFNWAPNGTIDAPTGTVGGTEAFDDENLNGTIGTTIAGNANVFSLSNAFSRFEATSGILAAGLYDFNLNMNESHVVQRSVVPEPGALALVGLALAGLGFTKRRKHS